MAAICYPDYEGTAAGPPMRTMAGTVRYLAHTVIVKRRVYRLSSGKRIAILTELKPLPPPVSDHFVDLAEMVPTHPVMPPQVLMIHRALRFLMRPNCLGSMK